MKCWGGEATLSIVGESGRIPVRFRCSEEKAAAFGSGYLCAFRSYGSLEVGDPFLSVADHPLQKGDFCLSEPQAIL